MVKTSQDQVTFDELFDEVDASLEPIDPNELLGTAGFIVNMIANDDGTSIATTDKGRTLLFDSFGELIREIKK